MGSRATTSRGTPSSRPTAPPATARPRPPSTASSPTASRATASSRVTRRLRSRRRAAAACSGPWSTLVVVVIVVAALSFFLKVPKSLYPTNLKHSAVEAYIAKQFNASSVDCNNGKDFKIEKGKSFTCTASGGKTFTVTLLDDNGKYQVSQG